MEHYSVLKNEVIALLKIKQDGVYVDATLGRAGHSLEILKQIPHGYLYAFDLDEEAIQKSTFRLNTINTNFKIFHSNYVEMKNKLALENIKKVDGILMDLGVSSPQFDTAERGFSYRFDGPLDMRMDKSQTKTAFKVVNEYSYQQLVKLLFEYGEEKFAKQIARNIEKARQLKPIETTFELVEIIKKSLPAKVLNAKGHPAKKTFQAIRIEVNDELKNLELAIRQALQLLSVSARLCVITFHSLEDRIVKKIFNEMSKKPKVNPRLPIVGEEIMPYQLVNKSVIVASEKELDENNRSHSAKLRVIERVI